MHDAFIFAAWRFHVTMAWRKLLFILTCFSLGKERYAFHLTHTDVHSNHEVRRRYDDQRREEEGGYDSKYFHLDVKYTDF